MDDQIWSAHGGDGPRGFVPETGDPETHGDFTAFHKAVTEKPKRDLAQINKGQVHLLPAGQDPQQDQPHPRLHRSGSG